MRNERRRGLQRARHVLGIGALSALAALGSACSGSASTEPPNVLLIVLDTVRADHLGCYGYERDTSPQIDDFARRATRYTRSVSSAPWTVPSHASLFTGKPPMAHGAHTFETEEPGKNVNPLGREQLTLAELLLTAGYQTAAFVANVGFLARHFQLDQGFETYHLERVYADELNHSVFEWLDVPDREPFFLFVNYIDAHRPYNTEPRPGQIEPPAPRDKELLARLVRLILSGTEPVPQELVRQVVDQYDTAVANMDEQVGLLLRRLEDLGIDDRTLVVITSDHGEYFGEHQLAEHSKDVYQEVIAVPLLVRTPGQTTAAEVVTPVVSNDVPHLILSHFPEPMRQEYLTLFPDAPGNHLTVAENYYTRGKDLFNPEWGWRFRRVRRAAVDWPHKYIHSSDGQHELYDLEQDPHESRNLIELRPEVARRLADRLGAYERQHLRDDISPDLSPLDEELENKLEALGYIGD